MKVSGFSFIRNAIKFDYQIKEAILSILPLCDEFVIAVGDSDDGTLEYIKSINDSKIKILETIWDTSLKGGQVMAVETNKALDACAEDSDWCIYIQGDEVMHEDDIPKIKEAMLKWKEDKRVQGLVFDHLNFFGTYAYYNDARHWQKKEIRVVRKDARIRSYKDAASFRMADGTKLLCKYVPAVIFHYGWVRPPKSMQQKQNSFQHFYHNADSLDPIANSNDDYDYLNHADSLEKFQGTHPAVMANRIARSTWTIDVSKIKNTMSARHKLLNFIFKKTGWHIGEFKNYKLI